MSGSRLAAWVLLGRPRRWWLGVAAVVAAAGWAGFLMWASVLPRVRNPIGSWSGADKITHMAAYGALAFAICVALRHLTEWRAARIWLVATIAAGLLWGGSTEVAQIFAPTRSFEWLDWAADLLGAAVFSWPVVVLVPDAKSGTTA